MSESVVKSEELSYISVGIGWLYFLSWSFAFYPQVIDNWRRKSVVGLNFDFAALNILGFYLYSVYNCGLFWSSTVREQYFKDHPGKTILVQYNDVFFALHAALLTSITVLQCCFYERGGQKVSNTARLILGTFFTVLLISLILHYAGHMTWLGILNICATIKLIITLIKYSPQAYMNYRRKSTVGYSIGTVILDLTGGLFSILQTLIDAYNHDNWTSIDPFKTGLAVFSIIFDLLFAFQHYVLYRKPPENKDIYQINE